ncbi:MAG: beta-aspartyl-peptidase [Candidatus Aminicenantes bacterium]|jgi:beta-aspartyl-dipeptidase (metallo-type)|nr:beta-aspartyl-peptidase [Candidatus Aminicenantes bacterium]
MAILIRQARVNSPSSLGLKDILIAGNRIEAVGEPGEIKLQGVNIETVEGKGKFLLPGLIDSHVHILGGGGEGGPATRAPEIAVEDIISSGVTTLIGCLGTDGITRHMTSLLAKARALEVEGITTYIYSGSYEIPVKAMTGSVRSDLVLIDKVIGAGEIAVSDHRSSQPTFEEIARLAAECRVGGMLGGKAGVLHIHMGDGGKRLELLFRLIKETEIPASQVIPTHVNRNRQLLDEAIEYVLAGGHIDLTAGVDPEDESDSDVSVETAVRLCLEKNVPLAQVTVSSDSNGSLPVFDKLGNLVGLTIATQRTLFKKFRSLVGRKIITLEQAAQLFAANPARFYKLHQKGEIKEGKDADVILLDQDLNLTDVIAKGRIMMTGGKLLAKGTFK